MNKRGMIWSHTGRQTVKDPGLEVLGPVSGDLSCPGRSAVGLNRDEENHLAAEVDI